ncbi:MAG: AAA family ATPase [Chloroflexi bacterium]|nr:AAA family ATPase [Chloroflexota bacterium]
MLLKKVKVQNYRALRDAEVEFDGPGVYLLLGPNGSGKSTLVDAARWAADGFPGGDWNDRLVDRGGYETCVSRGAEDCGITCEFTFATTLREIKPASKQYGNGICDKWTPQLHLESERSSRGATETRARLIVAERAGIILAAEREIATTYGRAGEDLDLSRGWRFGGPLRSFEESSQLYGAEILAPDGKNLLAFVASLQTREPDVWARALQAMCNILPESRLQQVLTALRANERVADLSVREEEAGQTPWRHVATGTKQVVFLVSLIVACPARSVIFIEEPECNLHPLAQRRLMEFALEEAQEYEKQIVVCTHSLDVIDCSPWKRAYVVSRSSPQIQPYENREIGKIIKEWWDVRRIVGGEVRDFLLFVEGPDDKAVWNFWLRRCGLEPNVTIYGRGGAGVINTARAVKTFNRFGVSPHKPFLLLLDHSATLPDDLPSWFDENEYYVTIEPDITAYLLLDSAALQKALRLDESTIADVLDGSQGNAKTKWALLVERAERNDGAHLKGRVAQEMAEIPKELADAVIARIREALSSALPTEP